MYVLFMSVCGTCIGSTLLVVIKHKGANSNGSLCSQETPRLLCLYLAFRPRFVLLDFCPDSAFLLLVRPHISPEFSFLAANVSYIIGENDKR